MRCMFFGTPNFALPALRALHASPHQVVLVVTQPDRPQGRGRRVQPPAVKVLAEELGLPVLQPRRASDREVVARLAQYGADAIVVAAYGQLLAEPLLKLCPHGCINLHPSLLPRHRGASPIAAALLQGDASTGVTTMLLDAGMDSGDLLLQESLDIHPEDTAASLHDRLAEAGAALLVATLRALDNGTITPRPQDASKATFTKKLRKEDGLLDWRQPARVLERQVRAYQPWPAAFTFHGGERLRVLAARLGPSTHAAQESEGRAETLIPGAISMVDSQGISLHTGQGILVLTEVQPANKPPMSAAAYVRGHAITPGDILGAPLGQPPNPRERQAR